MSRIRLPHAAAVVGAAAAVLAGITVVAAPAEASPPTGRVIQIGPGKSSCPAGFFCVWRDVNYQGPGVGFSGTADHWHHLGGLSWIDDNASSAFNNGTPHARSAIRTYNDAFHRGVSGCMSRGTSNANLQDAYDNKISSHRWVPNCSHG